MNIILCRQIIRFFNEKSFFFSKNDMIACYPRFNFFNENIKKMLRGVELYLLIFDIIYETKIAI